MALNVNPNNASTYIAIGFTHHLSGNLSEAVDYYHQALSLQPDDAFANDLLQQGLNEQLLDHDVDDVIPDVTVDSIM